MAEEIAADYDAALFEQLRACRKILADERNVPPYVIMSDRALQEMATYFPHSRWLCCIFTASENTKSLNLEMFSTDHSHILC